MSDTSLSKSAAPSASLPPATRKRVQACFDRGKQLAASKEFAYAHEMFVQCVIMDPANLVFVETMLQNLRAKFGGDRKKVGRLGGAHGLKKAIGRQNWSEALKLGIQQLESNPWHVATLCGLAEVCAGLHHNEVELVYLKQALEANPKDADVNRHCARSLARMGQLDQAIACWHRVETIAPGDKEAPRMISQLSDDKIWRAAELRDLAAQSKLQAESAAEKHAASQAQESVELRLSPRQLLERAIAEDPANIANYLELSELLVEQHRLNDAQRVLEQCLIACGDNPQVLEQLELVKSLQLEQASEVAIHRKPTKPFRMPWLEVVLGITVMALVIQLVPSLQTALLKFVWEHTQLLLFGGNVLFVAALVLFWLWQQRATN